MPLILELMRWISKFQASQGYILRTPPLFEGEIEQVALICNCSSWEMETENQELRPA